MSVVGEERKKRILDILETEGTVKVNSLSKILRVSTETVRRYLEELDQEEKLRKVYGGAIKVSFHKDEPSSHEREVIYATEKVKIGSKAATFVGDNEVIAIDDGSTTIQLAKHLKNKKNLTIVTHSIQALTLLIEYQHLQLFTGKIITLGGEVNIDHHRTFGQPAEHMLNTIFLDKSFLSTDGISLERGMTCYDPYKGSITKKLMEHSSQSILLVDHSKLDTNKHFKIADLKELNMIISNHECPKEWRKSLDANEVLWEIA